MTQKTLPTWTAHHTQQVKNSKNGIVPHLACATEYSRFGTRREKSLLGKRSTTIRKHLNKRVTRDSDGAFRLSGRLDGTTIHI